MDHPFRSAVLGGFHRQDVLNYLETTTREHGQLVDTLNIRLGERETQLSQERARGQGQETELALLRQEKEALEAQLQLVQRRAEDLEHQLANSREHYAEKSQEVQNLHMQVRALEDTVAALRPDAQAYLAIKDRTAGVELDAHRRAQLTLDEAKEQADNLQQQMRQWMGRVAREYSELRSRIDSTISHTARELGNVEKTLGEITALMQQQDAALDGLGRAYETETGREKVPAPMPLRDDG